MKKFKVTIRQTGMPRSITVIAACSIDAIVIVSKSLNPNEPSRLIVRAL